MTGQAGQLASSTPPNGDPVASSRGSVFAEATAGLAIGIGETAMSVGLAALLFSGPLSSGLPRASASFVLCGGLAAGIVAWRTRLPTAVAGTQDLGAIVLLGTAGSIAAGSAADPVATMVMVIALTTLISAVAMLLIARHNLSTIVRFLPSTVVAGFVAGTGWLLLRGGIDVMMGEAIGLGDLDLLVGEGFRFWIPGILLALAVVAAGRFERIPPAAIGMLVLCSGALFYVAVAAFSSVEAVGDAGWLLGPFEGGQSWRPISPTTLVDADWREIGSSAVPIAAAVFVSVIGILLNLTGFEERNSERVDLDNELVSGAMTNALAAPFGGMVAYHMLGDTTLAEKAGVRGRRVPMGIAAGMILVALLGGQIAGYVPLFIVGGMLCSVGLILLVESLTELWHTRHVEGLVTVAILVVVMATGMLAGVGFGIAAASAIFLYRYSRTDPVRFSRTGNDLFSTVERSPTQTQALRDHAAEIRIIQAQGYLFFGSIEALHAKIWDLLAVDDLHAVVIDFRHVTGVDLSAVTVLVRLTDELSQRDVRLLWSDPPAAIESTLLTFASQSIEGTEIPAATLVFPDLDQALEAAEDSMLVSLGQHGNQPSAKIDLSDAVLGWFDSLSVTAGEQVIRYGEAGDTLFLIIEGRCAASLPHASLGQRRLREFGPGVMFGEVGFRTGSLRTANVHAVCDAQLLALRRDAYDIMVDKSPALALELTTFILNDAAARQSDLTARLDNELK